MRVIVAALVWAALLTALDLWLYYPDVWALRPVVDIAATWTAAIWFAVWWKRRYGGQGQ